MEVQWSLRMRAQGMQFVAERIYAKYSGGISHIIFDIEDNGWRAVMYMRRGDDVHRRCNVLLPRGYFTMAHQMTLISPYKERTKCRDK
jgi:hypothetical protein